MKTNRLNHLIGVALGLTVFAATGCAEKARIDASTLPSVKTVAANDASLSAPSPTTAPHWSTLKDIPHEARARFFTGLKQMEAMVDEQIAALSAKRAAMTSTTNTADWDFAMKEMISARAHLKSTGEVLGKATPETWNQEKDRVGQAWVRTQEAFAKVKSSTTS